MRIPTATDIRAAALRIEGVAVRTPLLQNRELDRLTGGRILLKPESLQLTGSFKIRGAYNKLAQLSTADRARGVVTYSSGNHAQGVAAAAELLNLPATIVMPADAPAIKVARTRRSGAEVVFYDRWSGDRQKIAEDLARDKQAVLIPPYDDPDIIAGQGTVGLEIVAQARELGVENLDAVVMCCGGGGLTAGCALAVEDEMPAADIIIAEPEGFDETARSIALGQRVEVEEGQRSICDALLVPMPGELTFDINRRLVAGGVSVNDDDVYRAIAFAFNELKLVVEPGGAAALAAVTSGRYAVGSKTVAVVLTGGNIDPQTLAKALQILSAGGRRNAATGNVTSRLSTDH